MSVGASLYPNHDNPKAPLLHALFLKIPLQNRQTHPARHVGVLQEQLGKQQNYQTNLTYVFIIFCNYLHQNDLSPESRKYPIFAEPT